ncbi:MULTISPECIES: GerAB/ArcD/ProY family transporter [unclassified Bacillus (in: firmicutes)]|uniref:GerAB/ArcD/ProY family transporter n=1 Tax=unclassified Bacillus (in: firmicutes) TaxID=185979 RepID=UPI0008E094BB|nr:MULTISPECIES: GerAB/ArcD/ProY family transporter [unclassified Bacillus (in: firmicutes)]SFA89500.1 spore germination protein [Bacillus sp. UNCCL13]SFQ84935.1 spore germination protein [Bacillus sp. cl95]
MNTNPIDRITTSQAVMFISNFIFGAGILTLPRITTEKIKTPDSWIAVIVSGIFIMFMVFLIFKLCQRYPSETFYQFNQKLIGKWLGSLLSLIVVAYYIGLSAFEVRAMAETTRLFLLQGTPTWAVMMPFLWIGFYLVMGGINSIARMLEIIFPITVLFFLVVMFLGISIFEVDNIRPVLGMGVMPVVKGLTTTSLSFAGFEIILIIFMFMKEKNKPKRLVLLGVGGPIIFYTITVVMVIGALSIDGVLSQTWPVLTFVRSFEIKGLLFERFDSLLLVIWIMQIFATYIIALFAAVLGLAQVFGKSPHPFIYVSVPVIYFIAMIPKNINGVFKMGGMIGNFAFYLFCFIPILLLLISMVKERKHAKI